MYKSDHELAHIEYNISVDKIYLEDLQLNTLYLVQTSIYDAVTGLFPINQKNAAIKITERNPAALSEYT